MKKIIIVALGSSALLATPAFAQSSQSVTVSGQNAQVCTVTNSGAASITLTQADFNAINGGAERNVDLGDFNVYCNLPANLVLSSTQGALTNPIVLPAGVVDNGHKRIPYHLRATSTNSSFASESFTLPGGHAAGITGGQGFRKTKSSLNGITLDTVDFDMLINNGGRQNEQPANTPVVQDTRYLYAGTYSETATLTIQPAI
jgi:hypothetical protein